MDKPTQKRNAAPRGMLSSRWGVHLINAFICRIVASACWFFGLLVVPSFGAGSETTNRMIDRFALVTRHNIMFQTPKPENALTVGFPYENNDPASDWLNQNPHHFSLGQIGLVILKKDGSEAVMTDLENVSQEVDLWTGTIHCHFEVEGVPVEVVTVVHPAMDLVASRIESELFRRAGWAYDCDSLTRLIRTIRPIGIILHNTLPLLRPRATGR